MIAAAAALLVAQSPFASEAPLALTDIKVEPEAPVVWQPVEISFQLKGTWSDVFDPRQVFVTADIAGEKDLFAEVPGFVHAPPYGWKVRFAPWSTGKFSVSLAGFDTLGRVNAKKIEFSVKRSDKAFPGFVETKEKSRYFQRSDGKSQVVFGPKATSFADVRKAWEGGANCVTLDITDLTGKVDLSRFNDLESLLQEGIQADKYVFLLIGKDAWLREGWKSNPFFSKDQAPDSFFQSLQPRLAYKRYLRYLVARLNAYPSWAGVILWEGNAPEYWLEEMMEEVRALHPYQIPVMSLPTAIEWLREPWLRTSCTPFSTLNDFRALDKKPIVVTSADAATAVCSGAAGVIGATPFKGLAELANSIEWNKRNFDLRVVSGTGVSGSAMIDDSGGPLTISANSRQPTGMVGLAVRKNGKYSCAWFKDGVEIARTTAQSKDDALEIEHPAFGGALLGILKREG